MTDKQRTNSFGPRMNRRTFVASAATLAGAAGLAGVLPENLARAATVSAKPFDLSQVKHLVFQMQENRSFDHYFGTFPGARGFNDPHAIRLPTGRSVFQQPDPANPDGYLEPWHMSTITPAPRGSLRCPTTGATSTRRGTRARWTAGCSPTSPRTATPTARSPWATTPRKTSPSTGRSPRPSRWQTTTTARSWARRTRTGSSGNRAASTRRARPAVRSSRPAGCAT